MIKRVHVHYRLTVDADADREGIERVFEAHPPFCPVYKTLHTAFDISTELTLEEA